MRNGQTRRPAFILLTAKGEESDRIVGLRLGADDYVVKPFSPAELVARVDAVLRRVDPEPEHEPPLEFGRLRIEPAARRVLADGAECALTVREYELLLFLARHPGQAFSRHALMDRVWGYSFYTDTSTVTVHIRRLRGEDRERSGAAAPHRDGVGRSATGSRREDRAPSRQSAAALAAALVGVAGLRLPCRVADVRAAGAARVRDRRWPPALVLRRRTGLRRQAVLLGAIAAAQLLAADRRCSWR